MCHLLTFQNYFFVLKNAFENSINISNSFDSDQDSHSAGPDLGPNCVQRLSAGNKSGD